MSGNPWYPLECIVVVWCGGCFMQFIEGRCSKSVVIVSSRRILEGVSGVVGCLHMSVGLKIESAEKFSGQCVRHSL
jgi:hypothetical protein